MELGSDFNLRFNELQICTNSIFTYLSGYNCIFTDSGRSAISLISKCFSGKVLLPSYICDSVIHSFQGTEIQFYNINSDLSIDLLDLENKLLSGVDILYIVNFFGKLYDEHIYSWIMSKKTALNFTIIEDTTHSIFSNINTIGDFCICSLRKWLPISDGGVLYSKKLLSDIDTSKYSKFNRAEKYNAMVLKTLQLDNILECNYLYRSIFESHEKHFDNDNQVFLMSDLSKFILSCYNVNIITQKRKCNYNWLKKALRDIGIIPIQNFIQTECPFAFVIYNDNRDNLRQYLIQNHIYCAIHWPLNESLVLANNISAQISENILSLPIDHRYNQCDMNYLVEVLSKYEK